MWGYIRAPTYRRKPGRYALSNLYITNPNPNLPPILYSSITIIYRQKEFLSLLQAILPLYTLYDSIIYWYIIAKAIAIFIEREI